MIRLQNIHFIGKVHFRQKGELEFEKITETEYTSFQALELFPEFESVEITPKSVVDRATKRMQPNSYFMDLYDPNFYEVVEHKGQNRIAERVDRRFLVKP